MCIDMAQARLWTRQITVIVLPQFATFFEKTRLTQRVGKASAVHIRGSDAQSPSWETFYIKEGD